MYFRIQDGFHFPVCIGEVITRLNEEPVSFAARAFDKVKAAPKFQAEECDDKLAFFQLNFRVDVGFIVTVVPDAHLAGAVCALGKPALKAAICKRMVGHGDSKAFIGRI